MFNKIVRVVLLSVTATVLPGVIVACSGADAGPTTGMGSNPVTATGSATPSGGLASTCTRVAAHDDAKCKAGYTLLDGINDESCSALNDAAEEATAGALTMTAPSSASKGSPGSFSWSRATAKLTPAQRFLDALEPSAHAHGTFDGQAYMLVFADKGCNDLARVFTKGTSWTADAATWSKLAAATGPISVTVFAATIANSALKDGTTASASKPVAFAIK